MDRSEVNSERRVCSVDDLEDGEAIIIEIDGTEAAVFAIDDEVHALENVCPHQGGPLGEGKVEDGCVYCPWHGWQFDVATGDHVHGKATAAAYEVTVEDGDVYLAV